MRMMPMETDALIRQLAAERGPVRPLPNPWLRMARWLALALPYVVAAMFVVSFRDQLSWTLTDRRFVVEQVAALATGIAAAAAAFASAVPGYAKRWILLPVLPMIVWIASIGEGCLQSWNRFGPAAVALGSDWNCVSELIVIGAAPAIAMAMMLRRGAPLMPRVSMALGGLAAAGLANVGLRLVHRPDATILVLVWHVGAVCALALVAGGLGGRVLNWRSVWAASLRA